MYDVVVLGGGPAGLSAALALGRGRKRVLVCDGGPRRNAAAHRMYNFVSRDGTPPPEFRRIAREQLAAYPSVEQCDEGATEIRGSSGAFEVRLPSRTVQARRILLATGMIDEMLPIPGFAEAWGTSIFQCPYCHGYEVQDQAFGVLVPSPEMLEHALMLLGWTRQVVVLTDARFALPPEVAARLERAQVRVEERRVTGLVLDDGRLRRVELAEGPPLSLDVLFARPPQRQVPVVEALGVRLDPAGYVWVDEQLRETSVPGIYAGGDLITPMQGAILAAASGVLAAARLNHALTVELALSGDLP
jgi:thioredoxin reductase